MKLHENQLLITSAGRSVDRVGPDGVSGELACQVRIAELNVSCVLVGGPGLLLALLDCGLVKPVSNAVDGEGTEADTATNGKNCLGEAGGESGKVVQLAVSVSFWYACGVDSLMKTGLLCARAKSSARL